MRYFIKEVDGADKERRDDIRDMHDIVFGNEAPQVDPEFGYWWIVWGKDATACHLAGFAGLHPSLGENNAGYLVRSGVMPLDRGKGLQTRLIRVRERKARKLGWTALRTDATTDNPQSANNLIKAGYRVFTPEVRWALSNSIYWRKQL